jgi:hypothetical protein
MTTKSIAEQIDVIRNATAKAVVSRKAAAAFLERAGIIKVQSVRKETKSEGEIIPTLMAGKSYKRSGHSSVTTQYAKKKAK